jgi:hypothetical protein
MKTNVKNLQAFFLITGLLLLFTSSGKLFGQENYGNIIATKNPSVYLGLGLGVNDYGLGAVIEIPLSGKISVSGSLGLGGWGWKAGGSLNLYTNQISERSEFSLGYSYASGLKDFNFEMAVEPNETQRMLNFDLNPVETINLIYTYNLKIGNSCKAGFSAGYAIPVTAEPYYLNTSGVVLSSTSEQIMNIMQPGGLIIGIKFMFGL